MGEQRSRMPSQPIARCQPSPATPRVFWFRPPADIPRHLVHVFRPSLSLRLGFGLECDWWIVVLGLGKGGRVLFLLVGRG